MKKIIKNLKTNWRENRVLFVLTVILVICVILMVAVGINYFFGSSKDKYGERLEGIEKVKIDDKRIKDLETKISADEKIASCDVNQIGKMIYIDIKFNEGISLDDAKSKSATTLELFSEKELKFYDINFSLTQDSKENVAGFTIMGAKNVNGSGLVWNNNTPVEKKE